MFGDRRLDELRQEDIQRPKGRLAEHTAKTVNNVLTTLSTMLKAAVDWEVIPDMRVRIKQLKVTAPQMDFYDCDEYERIVEAAKRLDPRHHIMVLLGGDAGLRPGEVRALQWVSIDFRRRFLTVELAEYDGVVALPKHDKIRQVPSGSRQPYRPTATCEDPTSCTATTACRSRSWSLATGLKRPSGSPTCATEGPTPCDTPSAPTSRCKGRPPRRSRSSRVTRT